MNRVPRALHKSNIPSPLTGGDTTLSESLDPQVIIDRYEAHGIDVARYFDGLLTVDIYRCSESGYRFFHPPSLAGEADFYEQIYDPKADHDIVDPDYREWSEDYQYAFDRIASGERLLDVGCGFGYFLRRAAEKANVTGIDGSKFAQAHCERLGLNVHLGSVRDYRERFASSFDTVTSFQVLEHVYDVRGFLTDLISFVKPGGRLILAVPNNEPYLRRFDPYSAWNCPPHHVGLWNRESLERMAGLFGMVPTDHQYCEVSGRWVVGAYLHARHLMDIKTDVHDNSSFEKLRMLLVMPYTLPVSLWRHLRNGRLETRNVIVMTFSRGAALRNQN